MKVEKSTIDALLKELEIIEQKNIKINSDWNTENIRHIESIAYFNAAQDRKDAEIKTYKERLCFILDNLRFFSNCFDVNKANKIIESLPKPEAKKESLSLQYPDYFSTDEIKKKIELANDQQRKYDAYERDL